MSNSRVPNPYPLVNQVSDERWVPPLPDAQKPVDPNSPKCHGCGRYHSIQQVEVFCLRHALAQVRDQLRVARSVETVKAGLLLLRLRREVAELDATQAKDRSLTRGPRIVRNPDSFSQG